MNVIDLLQENADRPLETAHYFLKDLTPDQLNAHPADHDNSIAWLLWHTGREIDVQIEALGGQEVWKNQNFQQRFSLGETGDTVGYGHTPEQARSIIAGDPQLLLEYLEATILAYKNYVSTLTEADLDEVIDTNWNPPVTRGARLISIMTDASQHIGQAAYASGQVK